MSPSEPSWIRSRNERPRPRYPLAIETTSLRSAWSCAASRPCRRARRASRARPPGRRSGAVPCRSREIEPSESSEGSTERSSSASARPRAEGFSCGSVFCSTLRRARPSDRSGTRRILRPAPREPDFFEPGHDLVVRGVPSLEPVLDQALESSTSGSAMSTDSMGWGSLLSCSERTLRTARPRGAGSSFAAPAPPPGAASVVRLVGFA